MTYFMPQVDLIKIFKCPGCNRVYLEGRGDISCCVNHGPGSCCHYTDKAVRPDTLEAIINLLNGEDHASL